MNAASSEEPTELPWLAQVLNTVGEFGEASLELVAWELSLSEQALRPAWDHAIERRMIEPTSVDPESEEQMYRLVSRPDA